MRSRREMRRSARVISIPGCGAMSRRVRWQPSFVAVAPTDLPFPGENQGGATTRASSTAASMGPSFFLISQRFAVSLPQKERQRRDEKSNSRSASINRFTHRGLRPQSINSFSDRGAEVAERQLGFSQRPSRLCVSLFPLGSAVWNTSTVPNACAWSFSSLALRDRHGRSANDMFRWQRSYGASYSAATAHGECLLHWPRALLDQLEIANRPSRPIRGSR